MTKIMGIVNVTPDSFFNRFQDEQAISQGIKLYADGADILDIGGESTRPNSAPVSEEEELRRVIPIIEALSQEVPIPLSIDTMKPNVAKAALNAGASMINDVTGFAHPSMQELAASSQARLCVMHMQGTPQNMQINPDYPDGIIDHLLKWFDQRISLLVSRGVEEKNIMIDPGIGFGKTVDHNLKILQNLPKLKALGFPLLFGISRKSFLGKILNKTVNDLLPATIAINTMLILNGVEMIRVHDVSEHRQTIEAVAKLALYGKFDDFFACLRPKQIDILEIE